jgi:hypothetical protein
MQVVQMPKSRSDSTTTKVTPNPELEKCTRCQFTAGMSYVLSPRLMPASMVNLVAYSVVRSSIVTSGLIGVESMQNTASRGLAKACQVLHRERPKTKIVSPSLKKTIPV